MKIFTFITLVLSLSITLGSKPTDQYKDPTSHLLRLAAKPTDFYKDTSLSVIRNAKPTDFYKDIPETAFQIVRRLSSRQSKGFDLYKD